MKVIEGTIEAESETAALVAGSTAQAPTSAWRLVAAWLLQHGVTVPQVRSWAIHPGGPRILHHGRLMLEPSSGSHGDVSRGVG